MFKGVVYKTTHLIALLFIDNHFYHCIQVYHQLFETHLVHHPKSHYIDITKNYNYHL